MIDLIQYQTPILSFSFLILIIFLGMAETISVVITGYFTYMFLQIFGFLSFSIEWLIYEQIISFIFDINEETIEFLEFFTNYFLTGLAMIALALEEYSSD